MRRLEPRLLPAARPVYDATMARVVPSLCILLSVALVGCATGEETSDTNNGGFNTAPLPPTTMPPPVESGTTQPTTGDTTGRPMRMTETLGETTSDVNPLTTGDPPGETTVDLTTGPMTSSTTEPPIQCGDGLIEGTEECEGLNVGGKDCKALGFMGGVLTCNAANCTFDKSQCVSESCGDGTKNGGEECDCGQQGSPCTQAQLGDLQCGNLLAPNGGNYHGGELSCGSPASCLYNKAACTYCGDGVRNGPEACEGVDLGGATCQSLGFTGGGALKCALNCTHDTSSCVNIVCGDGQCNGGENSCTCAADCPDDPGTCSACQCGMKGGPNCWCDASCVQIGDCCIGGPC